MDKRFTQKILITGGSGYIGSELFISLAAEGHKVESYDLEWFGENVNRFNKKIDYRDLKRNDLKNYDTIIHLAATSSEKLCNKNSSRAYENNVVGFQHLLNEIDGQRLIYASTASVYEPSGAFNATEQRTQYNLDCMYNFTKFSMDCLAKLSNKNYFGLRLGDVNGPSPNLRTDKIINSMVMTALQKGRVDIHNSETQYPIVGMNDFNRVIEVLLNSNRAWGIYNISSFNASALDIGQTVSDAIGVPLYVHNDEKGYSLSLKTDKFRETFQFEFEDDVKSIIHHIREDKSRQYFGERAA